MRPHYGGFVTATRPLPNARINRAAYSGLGSTIVAWMVAVQGIGWFAGQYFQFRIGFLPVWFLECTACLPRAGWVPSSLPIFGGMSIWIVVAGLASIVLTVGKRRGMTARMFRLAAGVACVAMVIFTIVALDTRYPGSLPQVIVSVLPGAVAALGFGTATASPGSAIMTALDPAPMTSRSLTAVALGPLAMMLLGGLISIIALWAAVTGYFGAPDARNRRAAVGGLITGLLSFVMRWNLSGRYDVLGYWV